MPIKFHTSTRRCELGTEDKAVLEHELERLERRTPQVDSDLMHLGIHIEKHPKREEYEGSVRLFVVNRALPARRNRAPSVAALLRRAFEDVEQQLDRYKAQLRREPRHHRRLTRMAMMRPMETLALPQVTAGGGAAPPDDGWRAEPGAGQPPGERPGRDRPRPHRPDHPDRALWREALRGERRAFDELVRPVIPGLEEVIVRELEERGQPSSERTVSGIVSDVLGLAFRQLARRPPEQTLFEWLEWMVQTAIQRAEF
jgi:hypothetical protein